MNLNALEKTIHKNAVLAGHNLLRCEWPLILALREVDKVKLYKKLDKPSLFKYATDFLKLSDSTALTCIAVARKSLEVPVLSKALSAQRISVWKASRLVSTINNENADELVSFASEHGDRKIDFEVAKRSPKALPKDKVKPLSGEYVQVTMVMKVEDYEKLKRVESIEGGGSLGELVGLCTETHLERYDPVRKADRAVARTLRKQSSHGVRHEWFSSRHEPRPQPS